jgi:hypothetical protein
MAINVDSVYKAVLVVMEQEKRGVLTPAEFNKIATQAQQEIFTKYFDDLNQLLRTPQTSLAYADRMALLDEKIAIFKTTQSVPLALGAYTIPSTSLVQELGLVVYNNRETQRIQANEVYTTNQSPLTAPSAQYPVYTYENGVIQMYPISLAGNITLKYLRFPVDVKWGFTINVNLGNYVYNKLDSQDFEIHKSDQPLIINKILEYAGVMSKDQLVMSLAMQKEQQVNVNSKQ